jgi:hypothetical protein
MRRESALAEYMEQIGLEVTPWLTSSLLGALPVEMQHYRQDKGDKR